MLGGCGGGGEAAMPPSAASPSTPSRIVRSPAATPGCQVTARLIPSCGAWWGIAPEISADRGPRAALARAERRMQRRADIVHLYHHGPELFPTAEEIALARDPVRPRLLFVNWKPSLRHTWADIAAGAIDRRIDRLAAHLRRTFPERFFLTIHHEPESDVAARPGSGKTAEDYAAMYRHVVMRLRQAGVKSAVTVMTYMGTPTWAAKPWFERLYPGDDVVDWVAIDPYVDKRVRDFDGLINRKHTNLPNWPGFYRWMQWRFPGKPIMIAEWGVFERHGSPALKERFYSSVRAQIRHYPQLKALIYFDSRRAPRGDTRFDTTRRGGRAFSDLARDPYFALTSLPSPTPSPTRRLS
ncbi:hypothetical protein Ssi02_34880 [Sinosporangium siamense]|uniref:GH26 domain-containing protein n=1 Tax=Sinosporangium siamense TaxID=1367973 RepID=A0A919V8I1_9ACTN|nr:hypothetical protein Ssi02_34880 [Sinosporangium siamense]